MDRETTSRDGRSGATKKRGVSADWLAAVGVGLLLILLPFYFFMGRRSGDPNPRPLRGHEDPATRASVQGNASPVEVVPPEEPPEPRRPSTLVVSARSSADVPILVFRVRVDGGDEQRSPDNGVLELEREPGRHRVEVRWGSLADTVAVDLAQGERREVAVVLEAPCILSGRVFDADSGAAVAGASVDVNGQPGTSGDDGQFSLPYPLREELTRQVFASASHPDYWPTGRQLVTIGGSAHVRGIEVPLTRGAGDVRIVVTGAQDQLLAQIPVELAQVEGTLGKRLLTTDDHGEARFAGVPAGEFEAAAGGTLELGLVVEASQRFKLSVGEQRRIQLSLAEIFAVQVNVPAGLGLIVMHENEGLLRRDPAAGPSEWMELALPCGKYELFLLDGETRVASRIAQISTPMSYDLTFEEATPISGRIGADAGSDRVGIGLEPLGSDGPLMPASRLVRPDEHGFFRFEHLLPGRYRLVAPDGWHFDGSPIVATDASAELEEILLEASPGADK